MLGAMPTTKRAASKRRTPSSSKKPERRKVTGTVLKIVNGKPTDEKLSAEKAFSDLEQARAQVLYCEQHGSGEEKRLVRLAFRQYQGIRFRAK